MWEKYCSEILLFVLFVGLGVVEREGGRDDVTEPHDVRRGTSLLTSSFLLITKFIQKIAKLIVV